MKKKTIIIGAGVGGIAASVFFAQKEYTVEVYVNILCYSIEYSN